MNLVFASRMFGGGRNTVKFSNRKAFPKILRKNKQLRYAKLAVLDLPQDAKIFVNKSSCPYYRGIWNKFKKLKVYHSYG